MNPPTHSMEVSILLLLSNTAVVLITAKCIFITQCAVQAAVYVHILLLHAYMMIVRQAPCSIVLSHTHNVYFVHTFCGRVYV